MSTSTNQDRETFCKEAMPHLKSIYRTAVQSTRDPALAEDLTQETFQEAWKSFGRYKRGTNCKAWLFRIFFRVRSRYLRTVSRLKEVPLDEVSNDKLEEPSFESKVEARLVLRALETLPDYYRIPLILADIEELGYKEIAAILQIPIGTVMSRLNRARSLLRRMLTEPGRTAHEAS